MKSFSQFITEVVTQASAQATKMGLQGDGHGDWYDKEGNLVAKTVNAKLKFFGKKRRPTADERTKIAVDKVKAAKEEERAERDEVRKKDKAPADITVAFGRFNPPHIGHEKLLKTIKQTAGKGEYVIYPSRSEGNDRNPIDAKDKIELMKSMFPDYSERIVDDDTKRTIFDVLKDVYKTCATNVNVVVGADRYKEFNKIANNWNGEEGFWDFERVKVVNAGERDAESHGVEGASASKMRDAAIANRWDDEYYPDDYEDKDKRGKISKQGFSSLIPKGFDDKSAKKLFNTLRDKLGSKNVKEMWRIVPRFDIKNLRENFVSGKLFQVDDIVENDHTGLIGKIIRKGTNYVIAVTESNIMFKSWITDITEWTDPSGVGPDQRLIGTDAHLRYIQSISHPQAYRTVPIKKFINKFRAKRAKKNA